MYRLLITSLVYLGLAMVLTWPAVALVGQAVPGAASTEAWNGLWALNHWADALFSFRVPWRVESLNFPNGGTFLVGDPVGCTLVSPIVWGFGPTVGFSVLVWFQLSLAGVVTHKFAEDFLLWRRGGGKVGFGPWVSGTAMMVAPLLASHVHNGATEALWAAPAVWSVWMFWRAATRPGVAYGLWASVALVVATVCHIESGFVAAVFGLSLTILGAGGAVATYTWRRWWPLVTSFALAGYSVWAVGIVLGADDGFSGQDSAASIATILRTSGAADPLSYLWPGSHWSPDFRITSDDGERFMHVHYLGFISLGLGFWAWLRRRRHTGFLLAGGAVCLVLSLGPVLMHAARPVLMSGELAVPLPYYLLEAQIGFQRIDATWNFSLGPVLCLSLLGGLAVDLRGKRLALLAVALLMFEARVISPSSALPGTLSTVPEASILALKRAPPGAVINYPLLAARSYLAEQSVHGKPVAGTPTEVANPQAKRLWARMLAEAHSDPDTFHRAVSTTAERLGIRYLVIHTDPDAPPDIYTTMVRELEMLFGVPGWGSGQTRVVVLW
jgi:hypothetical protein